MEHTHTTRVPGCSRCDLGADEALAIEVTEAVGEQARRLAEEAPAVTRLSVGHGYALVRVDSL